MRASDLRLLEAATRLREANRPTRRPWRARYHGVAAALDAALGDTPVRLSVSEAAPIVTVARGVHAVRVRMSTAYLIEDDDVLVVVDTGAPGSTPSILRAVHALGRTPADVAAIVLTHAHLDHVGSLRALQGATGAPAVAHAADALGVASPGPLPNPFRHPAVAAVSGPFLRRVDPGPAPVEVIAEDGDVVPGAHEVSIVHLPGHTPGSIAVLVRGVLIAGDAMERRRGRLGEPSRLFTQDMPAARASIRRLGDLDFDTLILSHFDPIRGNAAEVVREFASTLRG